MTDDERPWLERRKTTNQLLGFVIVVIAAGFVSIGGEYGGLQIVARLVLTLVLFSAIVLFLGRLIWVDEESDRNADG